MTLCRTSIRPVFDRFGLVLLLLTAVLTVHAADEEITPEELISRHLESIGPDEARQQIATRIYVGEGIWRMPLHSPYKSMIKAEWGTIKNVGGREAGSITAAQFLQRFIEGDTPWAHLDIAGTAMGSPASETNRSWGSGFGVRLLDELVREKYEV